MATLWEIVGSGDFTRGYRQVQGKCLCKVLDAASQDEAEVLALTEFPPVIGGIPRNSIDVKDVGGGVFEVEVSYERGVPENTGPGSADKRPAGGGKNNSDKLTRDMTFSTGGGTKKRLTSIQTLWSGSATAGEVAPDFGGLIGVGKDGKIEGVDVIAPTCDFTISKRFQSLDVGWFRNMMDLVACQNESDWLGLYAGEVLFKGADGNYKDGDDYPWHVTGKFGYARNYTRGDSAEIDSMLTPGGIQIPALNGWDYLWISYLTKTETITYKGKAIKVPVDYPRWAYIEQIYYTGDLSSLGLDV